MSQENIKKKAIRQNKRGRQQQKSIDPNSFFVYQSYNSRVIDISYEAYIEREGDDFGKKLCTCGTDYCCHLHMHDFDN